MKEPSYIMIRIDFDEEGYRTEIECENAGLRETTEAMAECVDKMAHHRQPKMFYALFGLEMTRHMRELM